MITLALDGSEDYLTKTKLINIIGKETLEFRDQLLSSEPAATTFKELYAQMIKPEGVQIKSQTAKEKSLLMKVYNLSMEIVKTLTRTT